MLAVAIIAVALAVLLGLLLLSAWLERAVLSPRALIAMSIRSNADPDVTEHVVAAEAERILTDDRE